MKTEIILAFKKKLSKIDNYNDINIKYSTQKYFGGYSFINFDKFELNQMMWSKLLRYNNTQVELETNEWLELKSLVEDKKSFLQKTDSCKDYVEIMEIIKS